MVDRGTERSSKSAKACQPARAANKIDVILSFVTTTRVAREGGTVTCIPQPHLEGMMTESDSHCCSSMTSIRK
jgi:hypothetical protein